MIRITLANGNVYDLAEHPVLTNQHIAGAARDVLHLKLAKEPEELPEVIAAFKDSAAIRVIALETEDGAGQDFESYELFLSAAMQYVPTDADQEPAHIVTVSLGALTAAERQNSEILGRLDEVEGNTGQGKAVKEATALLQSVVVRSLAAGIADDEALRLGPVLREWADVLALGGSFAQDEPFTHEGQVYRAVEEIVPAAHQAPGGEGMLALYRPVDNAHRGTKADPYLFVYGMDVKQGKHYSYGGKVWLWDYADTAACIWHPGQAGVHFWREVIT